MFIYKLSNEDFSAYYSSIAKAVEAASITAHEYDTLLPDTDVRIAKAVRAALKPQEGVYNPYYDLDTLGLVVYRIDVE